MFPERYPDQEYSQITADLQEQLRQAEPSAEQYRGTIPATGTLQLRQDSPVMKGIRHLITEVQVLHSQDLQA